MSVAAKPFASFHELPRLIRVGVAMLAVGAIALTVRLWPEWQHNPDLSHGFFMPVVFLLLLFESRHGTPRFLRNGPGTRLVFAGLLLLGLLALVATGLYAASVDWSHPIVNYSLTVALVAFLGAGLVLLSGEGTRFFGCNWNAIVAIVLWMFSAPIPPGTYSRLTLTLQLWVSEAVLRALHILGIAAIRHGNIIELAQATVGVEEACSGVRSLISCIFAGLFFSATLVRRPWARIAIIVLSAPLALVMNFVRSLTLTLLASSGVDIAGTWHDATGFAVLGVTAVLLAGLAWALERIARPLERKIRPPAESRAPAGQALALTVALGLAAVMVFVAAVNTHSSVRQDSPAPDLEALLPAAAPGWQVTTSNDLYQFRDALQTDHLAQRIYRRPRTDGTIDEIILYVAFWHAGQAPVSLVASHTPDACWPGSGWTVHPSNAPQAQLFVDHRTLPTAEYRLFTFGDFPQHVWFWHLYDGRPIAFRDPYSAIALLRIAWEYGFRHDGDQLFVRVSSNRPWSQIQNEPLLQDFFHRAKPLGL